MRVTLFVGMVGKGRGLVLETFDAYASWWGSAQGGHSEILVNSCVNKKHMKRVFFFFFFFFLQLNV